MGSRVVIVGALLAVAAGVAWLVLRDDGAHPKDPAPVPAGSADPTRPASLTAPPAPSLPPASAGDPKPELPPHPSVPPAPTANERFEEESRDEGWASKTEAELGKRWKKIRAGKLESTECRQTQCRLTVVGSEQDVGTAVADLEGPRGLHGYARNVLLTSPERTADGISLRIFVRFDR